MDEKGWEQGSINPSHFHPYNRVLPQSHDEDCYIGGVCAKSN